MLSPHSRNQQRECSEERHARGRMVKSAGSQMVRAMKLKEQKKAVDCGRIRCVRRRLILTCSVRNARSGSQRLKGYGCRVCSCLSWSPCSTLDHIGGGLKGNIFGLEGTVHLGELNGTNGGVYPDYFRRRFFAGFECTRTRVLCG